MKRRDRHRHLYEFAERHYTVGGGEPWVEFTITRDGEEWDTVHEQMGLETFVHFYMEDVNDA